MYYSWEVVASKYVVMFFFLLLLTGVFTFIYEVRSVWNNSFCNILFDTLTKIRCKYNISIFFKYFNRYLYFFRVLDIFYKVFTYSLTMDVIYNYM